MHSPSPSTAPRPRARAPWGVGWLKSWATSTWAALKRGIPIEAEERVSALAGTLAIEVQRPTLDDGRQYTVLADGVDVTWAIREARVNDGVSPVAAYPGVRDALRGFQRRIGARGGVVMVGRDIGTVVLPDADVKIYLDATLEERARRRHVENLDRGRPSDYGRVREELQRRDLIDSTRTTAPLTIAPDAVYVDSTDMTVEEVVARILDAVREASTNP